MPFNSIIEGLNAQDDAASNMWQALPRGGHGVPDSVGDAAVQRAAAVWRRRRRERGGAAGVCGAESVTVTVTISVKDASHVIRHVNTTTFVDFVALQP